MRSQKEREREKRLSGSTNFRAFVATDLKENEGRRKTMASKG